MPSLDTIVIGAGQAGLAMSSCLSERGVDHVVLERGRIADRWLTERWDSLRLLTPNWMSRLPGWSYDGADPDGFMTAAEVAGYFARYAHSFDAPVAEESAVESLRFDGEAYEVRTTAGTWTAQRVVLATGWCDRPVIPAMAGGLPPHVRQIAPNSYRNPSSVADGGVLVVGASATGVQLADELRASGRDVVLAVGRHSRLPRRYRGMDIFWWLDRIGVRDKTIGEMPDAARARHEPSLQLVGGPDRRSVDLTTLQEAGVQIAGRLAGINGDHVRFADDLGHTVTEADRRMRRVLAEIDRHIDETGLTDEVLAPEPMAPVRAAPAPDRLDLSARGIKSVVWATGHRRTYPWLHVPVLDEHGEIRHRRGITPAPGLYVLGQKFQHARNSDSIDGVGRDAEFVADHLTCRTATAPHHH